MTFPSRCCLRATAKRKPAGYGPMFVTIGLADAPSRPPCGLPIRRIAKGYIRQIIFTTFEECCRPTGYAGFNRLYEQGRIVEAACWAHVRRKFYDLYQAHASPIAEEALKRIGALYEIEEQIRGRPPDVRQQIRQQRTRPLMDSLHLWLKQCLLKLFKKSDVAMAIQYALDRWDVVTAIHR
jgi:transposase